MFRFGANRVVKPNNGNVAPSLFEIQTNDQIVMFVWLVRKCFFFSFLFSQSDFCFFRIFCRLQQNNYWPQITFFEILRVALVNFQLEQKLTIQIGSFFLCF